MMAAWILIRIWKPIIRITWSEITNIIISTTISDMFVAHIKGTETKDRRIDLIELRGKTTKKKRRRKATGTMIVNATLRTKKQAKLKTTKMINIQINLTMKATKVISLTSTPINKKKVLLRRERKRIRPRRRRIKITIHKRKLRRLPLRNNERELLRTTVSINDLSSKSINTYMIQSKRLSFTNYQSSEYQF